MKRRPIGPKEIRKYLVSVYITQGYEAAKPLAIKYGYRPRYLCQMSKEILGHYRTIFYSRHTLIIDQSYRFDPRFEFIKTDSLQEAA